MKKNLLIIAAAAAMILGSASCTKETLSQKAGIEISGKTLDEIRVPRKTTTRVGIDSYCTPFFEVNDEIFGWDAEGNSYSYKCTDVTQTAFVFARTSEFAPSAEQGTTVNLVHAPGYGTTDIVEKALAIDLSSQSGSLPLVMHAMGKVDGEGCCELEFNNDVAVIEIKDAVLTGAEENQEFTMSLEGSNTRLQMSLSESESLNCEANTPGTITDAVKVKADAQGKVSCRFAVPASGGQVNIKVKASGSKCYVFDFGEKEIVAGKYITAEDKTFEEDASAVAGALPGEFSASESGKVRFAQGNLFWDGDSFEFEAKQYSAGSWNAENHINYFFWSKEESVAKAASYADASATASDVFFTNATAETAKADFTVSGVTGKFRTLSAEEWTYILSTRENAADLLVEDVTVCGVEHCLIIAPDACLNDYAFDNTKTSYDTADWATAEAAGLVCLPPAGYRDGTEVKSGEGNGFYWSSTTDAADKASNLGFKKSDN